MVPHTRPASRKARRPPARPQPAGGGSSARALVPTLVAAGLVVGFGVGRATAPVSGAPAPSRPLPGPQQATGFAVRNLAATLLYAGGYLQSAAHAPAAAARRDLLEVLDLLTVARLSGDFRNLEALAPRAPAAAQLLGTVGALTTYTGGWLRGAHDSHVPLGRVGTEVQAVAQSVSSVLLPAAAGNPPPTGAAAALNRHLTALSGLLARFQRDQLRSAPVARHPHGPR